MTFIKWLRKYKQKIMVWVVVLIMITFVGGFSLRQLLAGGGQQNKTIATAGNMKITINDRIRALNELELLRDMGAGQMLYAQRTLVAPLVAQLLFPDSGSASMLDAQLKYAAMQGNLIIEDSLVQAFFNANTGDSPIYWILLNKEAQDLGYAVSIDEAMEIYRNVALGITQGQGQASTIVANLSRQHKVPQEAVVDIFAKLLSVMAYVDGATKMNNVSLPEIAAKIGYDKQEITATYVEFRADSFTAGIEEVDEAMLQEQFESYKGYKALSINDNNPYGFGYKIPDRVCLEYIIIDLDDVETLVRIPTEEEMETHYSRNRSRYTEEPRQDGQNPQSQTTPRIKSYSEVREQIKNELIEQRTNARAEMIMGDIRADIGRDLLDKDTENMSGEEIKQFAGDYAAAAKKAAENAGIAVYSGKTGYLSQAQLRSDSNLGRLSEQRPGRMPVELAKKAFAVQGLDIEKISRFDGVAPKIYENIGPMKGMYPRTFALVRVVDFAVSEVAPNIDYSYDITKSSLAAEQTAEQFSVREQVVADCKTLLAMQTAQARAEKFLETAGDDWQAAIDAYNEASEVKIRKVDMPARKRMSAVDLQNARIQAKSSPYSRLEFTIRNKMMLDTFYNLQDADMPVVAELPASKSVVALKEVGVIAPTVADYEDAKLEAAATIEFATSLKAAFIHLNADNITARTNFEYVANDDADFEE